MPQIKIKSRKKILHNKSKFISKELINVTVEKLFREYSQSEKYPPQKNFYFLAINLVVSVFSLIYNEKLHKNSAFLIVLAKKT